MSFRVTDPETSEEAFRSLDRNHDCLMILVALVELDRESGSGANAAEIQRHLTHQGNWRATNSIGSRLRECERVGWVYRTQERRPGETVRTQQVWRPHPAGCERAAA